MTNQQDLIYLNKVLGGDIDAFSYFVDTYQQMAFTVAVRIVQNREEAEDIVQEAFVKCFHKLGSFKGDSKFSSWLYRIVYHKALDAKRKQQRTLNTQPIELSDYKGISDMRTFLDEMITEQATILVKAAISRLSEEDQTIVTLYYYDSLSLKEISEIISVRVETVKVKLFRARKLLYQALKDCVELKN